MKKLTWFFLMSVSLASFAESRIPVGPRLVIFRGRPNTWVTVPIKFSGHYRCLNSSFGVGVVRTGISAPGSRCNPHHGGLAIRWGVGGCTRFFSSGGYYYNCSQNLEVKIPAGTAPGYARTCSPVGAARVSFSCAGPAGSVPFLNDFAIRTITTK